ncbi:AarF/ABC1/UbiB kinase family protein [Chroococcus sp. FPU101]|uniref:ABC1 kinase family protein n=1 Tax=Chroococcus sp. FPU101 TaxID=1974212 RepID=UPI001A8F5070|nr:AarF/ABC1/UbiB kinase family protein [Chroococcus sp. FPU101]GFE71074.1 ABC-1 domain protein [Chroococcus sp. FPU101]
MLTQSSSSQTLRWQRSKSNPLRRQIEIFLITTQFLFFLWWDQLFRRNSAYIRQQRAKWLVKQLLNLGPTFIKIGQSLSTRADLIPLEYVQAFSQLQDRVPEFSSIEAINIIETELGKPITELFQTFDSIPLASASLGQVHRAKLYSGEEVVVKVQRTGLEQLFNLDFAVVAQLIQVINILPTIRKYHLEEIYIEFFELLLSEIDYINEGKNADRFRENFKDYPQVKVPLVYWDYTKKKVLTLEYLPGIKVDDRKSLSEQGIDLDQVIQTGICSYLKQLLIDGFFQSDPHPGNMAVDLQGELIFYDFGTMAEVKSMAKDQMIKTFMAVLKKDTDEVLETLIYMGLIEPISDLKGVRRIIQFLLDEFRDKPVDIKAFERISEEVYLMFKQQPFRLPSQMTFIIKSITTLDGIARALDPKYNLLAASQPFVMSITMSDNKGNLILNVAKQTANVIKQSILNFASKGQQMRQLQNKIEQGELEFRVRSLESERTLKKIYLAIKGLIYTLLTGVSIFTAFALLTTAYSKFAIIVFGLSGLFSLFVLRCLITLMIRDRMDKV